MDLPNHRLRWARLHPPGSPGGHGQGLRDRDGSQASCSGAGWGLSVSRMSGSEEGGGEGPAGQGWPGCRPELPPPACPAEPSPTAL